MNGKEFESSVQETSLKPLNPVTLEPLKEDWRWVKLGEVCIIDSNQVLPNTDLARKLPYIGLEHIESGTGRVIEKINDQDGKLIQSITFRFDCRHVLYGKLRPYLNKVVTPDFEGRCTTELLPLLPKDGCDRDYLVWIFRWEETVSEAMRHKTGTRMPRADMDELFKMLVPLPPLHEQIRIATKVQELMQEVKRACAACEKQLEAAKALPSAHLRAVFESEESKKWERKKLGEVCEIVSKGTTPTTYGHSFVSSGVPFLRAEDIIGGPVDFSSVTLHITKKTHDFLARSKLYPGDLLITIAGTLGRVGYVPDVAPEANCNQAVAFARVDPTKAYVKFLCYVLQVQEILAPFTELKAGGTIQNLNLEQVRRIEIPLPDLSAQWRIVDELKEKMPQGKNLQSAIQNQQSALIALPQSILRKAFRGEL